MSESVLIVGAGQGLSESLARLCVSKDIKVALAARNITKLDNLKKEISAETYQCDTSDIESVSNLFEETDKSIGIPNLVIYNASSRPKKGSVVELDPIETQKAINVTCFGAFLVAQETTKRMLKRKSGSIFFTGATAGVKGSNNITNCLKEVAKKIAMSYKWEADSKAPARQYGKVSINFTPNN